MGKGGLKHAAGGHGLARPYSMVSLSALEERTRPRRRSSLSVEARRRLSTVIEMPVCPMQTTHGFALVLALA